VTVGEAWPGRPWDEITEDQNRSVLVTRRITTACDQSHTGAQDTGCANPGCECWCHE
jgi:hypothetical protein